jgi:hypothetical protein
MKTAQQIINFFKEEGWCLNQSKMKLLITAYDMGYQDAEDDLKEQEQEKE